MSNIDYAFFITLFAGLSTLIGFLFIYIRKDRVGVISKSLGFASGVMITVSIFDLIPNSFRLLRNNYKNIYVLLIIFIGITIGAILSNLINNNFDNKKNDNKLYKLGIITMFAIIFHNIPEGIVTYVTTTNNIKLGISLAIAISLHNIPEGISISIPIYYSTNNKFKSFLYTFISGVSEPIGALIAYMFLAKYINSSILGILYSVIAGLMLNIGYSELYKESINYNKVNTIKYFFIGFIIMLVSHLILN